MNANNPINPASLDEYENLAVKNSNNAKRIAAGAAIFAGGAAVAGGASYAMTTENANQTPLTEMDVTAGADVASAYHEEVEQTHTKVVKVQPQAEPKPEPESEFEWNEEKNIYVDGEKVTSIETGKYEGHNFAIIDDDGNGLANHAMIDMNDNGSFESNEVVEFTDYDAVRMGNHAPKVNNHYFQTSALNKEEDINNDFADEKTGEEYHDDLAENNPDYNPNGMIDGYSDSQDIVNDDIMLA